MRKKINEDLALYICDRTKAFGRVDHSWLVTAACRLRGWICIWWPALADYLRDQDVIILGGGCRGPLTRCIPWIVVLVLLV